MISNIFRCADACTKVGCGIRDDVVVELVQALLMIGMGCDGGAMSYPRKARQRMRSGYMKEKKTCKVSHISIIKYLGMSHRKTRSSSICSL